jgi:hypothetical protein
MLFMLGAAVIIHLKIENPIVFDQTKPLNIMLFAGDSEILATMSKPSVP